VRAVIVIVLLLATTALAHGQIENILNRAKQKAEEKVKEKVEGNDQGAEDPVESGTGEESEAPDGEGQAETKPSGIKAYSKFDFVPGEKVLVIEDFMQDAVGDFPDKWNTNTSAETVTLDGIEGHWLMINRQGVFMPEFIDSLPDDFTFEFDLLCDNPGRAWSLYTSIITLSDRDHPEQWDVADNRFTFTIAPAVDNNSYSTIERRKAGIGEAGATGPTKHFSDRTKPVHVAVWRQKERVRVYFNEEKVWDLPKAMAKDTQYNSIVYWLQGSATDANYFMSNLRLAVGAPDTRNKLLTEGKWVTHGILFDVNSATIKPESYGSLKEIANVLKENAEVRIRIIGHTDADGDEAKNLDLSKRRAASVKEVLVKEFLIEESRMETEGMGETNPVDANTTPEGKANNRRVEFVKL
jgi:outer membrane protein OmpA-like peptidoglycan-associated protein